MTQIDTPNKRIAAGILLRSYGFDKYKTRKDKEEGQSEAKGVEAKKAEDATSMLREATRGLAKAASKGIVHKNTASRRISRLTAQVRKLATK